MKREILFRGLRTDGKGWVYGMYLKSGTNHHTKDLHVIYVDEEEFSKYMGLNSYCVIPESVGQYTGLTDKNGVKIFEGDYIGMYDSADKNEYLKYSYDGRLIKINKYGNFTVDALYTHDNLQLKVIGNIHENK